MQAVVAASSGPRFVELLWRFALHCLRLAWQRECQAPAQRQGEVSDPAQACPAGALPAAGAAVAQGRVDAAEACLSAELARRARATAGWAVCRTRGGLIGHDTPCRCAL